MTESEIYDNVLDQNNIIVARAGATPDQCNGRIISAPGSGFGKGLTQKSINQIRKSLSELKSTGQLRPERVMIYTDLESVRGSYTAEEIHKYFRPSKIYIPIFHTSNLSPRFMGDLEGQDCDLRHDLMIHDEKDPTQTSWGEESILEGMGRSEDLIRQITDEEERADQDIILVTGNFIASCIQCLLDGSPAVDHYKKPKLHFGEMRKITKRP
jgi:hypothetical protein